VRLRPDGEQYRKAFDRNMLEIPAVNLTGRGSARLRRRELAEETGFCAGQIRHWPRYTPRGLCSETLHIYLATELKAGPRIRMTGSSCTSKDIRWMICWPWPTG
jgi:hypothetical protein